MRLILISIALFGALAVPAFAHPAVGSANSFGAGVAIPLAVPITSLRSRRSGFGVHLRAAAP